MTQNHREEAEIVPKTLSDLSQSDLTRLTFSFYSPLKSINSKTPSGDVVIFRGLVRFFEEKGIKAFFPRELSGRRRKYFAHAPKRKWLWNLVMTWHELFQRGPDVLLSYHVYYKAPDWVHPFVSFCTKKPYVIYEGSFKPSLVKSDFFHYWLMRFTFWQASLIICANRADYEVLHRLFPKTTIYTKPGVFQSLVESPLNLEDNKVRSTESQFLVASMAMLRSKKKYPSVSWLVDVIAELQSEGMEIGFHHIGGGENFDALKIECEKKLKSGSYDLHGTLTPEEARKILSKCDVFAYPGIGESFGMAYLEAQQVGLPIVAFKNGGIPEAVKDEVSGFLVDPFDVASFKAKLVKLSQDQELRTQMSKQAMRYIADEHNNMRNYQQILSQIVSLF